MIFGLWGLYLVIHFIGHTRLVDFISIIVGLALVAVGVMSFLMMWKRRNKGV
jgi:divalent metal cation (Fe/Co/Zn/Cd) transporter